MFCSGADWRAVASLTAGKRCRCRMTKPTPPLAMPTPEPFVYRLKALVKVVDGDTLDLDLDLGFSLVLPQRVRLYGLDAPEIRSKDPSEKAKGAGEPSLRERLVWPAGGGAGAHREGGEVWADPLGFFPK